MEKSSAITWYTKKYMNACMGPVRFLWTDLRRRLAATFLVSQSEDEVGSDGRKGFMNSSRCCGVNCFPWNVPRRKAVSCADVMPVAEAIVGRLLGVE